MFIRPSNGCQKVFGCEFSTNLNGAPYSVSSIWKKKKIYADWLTLRIDMNITMAVDDFEKLKRLFRCKYKLEIKLIVFLKVIRSQVCLSKLINFNLNYANKTITITDLMCRNMVKNYFEYFIQFTNGIGFNEACKWIKWTEEEQNSLPLPAFHILILNYSSWNWSWMFAYGVWCVSAIVYTRCTATIV